MLRISLALNILILLGVYACADDIDFNRDIRPILSEKCFACHGPDAAAREADLRLDVREAAMHAIKPGEPAASELIKRISASDPESKMPPAGSNKKLSRGEIERLRQWIEQGAVYAKHWSFVPPRRPAEPMVKDQKWVRNPIDRFVLARLESAKLRPSREAAKTTLIRRVTLDLTGLPPTIAEVDAFLADSSPSAYEKVVDRLFKSTRYGEHMAGPWLDASRYADTDGYQNDRYRYQSPWRDWVILAMNENKPFDQFVIEQIAGDMLPNATFKQQVATGFCRNHRINSEDGSIPAEWHVENVVDRVDTLGTVFLGLTIGCARCHEHKFDPISQKEYYQLFAYFNNVPEWGVGPNNGNSPPFIDVPPSWPKLSPEANRFVVPAPVMLRRARENEAGNGLKRPQAGSPKTVMIMHELDKPRKTYVLQRGQYNMPDTSEVLSPGVPSALTDMEKMPTDRLGLARWLVDRNNPLTARVTVNRYWQQFFGTGLVKTAENFGVQGELPSHPQLLDWLAVEFMKNQWNVKQIQKTIVMSATYRQSSNMTAQRFKQDPENRRLARGPRFRLHPFALRDQALAVSGLLTEKIGGPSVKPYMPPRIWKAISNNTYKQDKGDALYRRSLYTYWRRTIPPPTMLNFNSAEREVCVVRKDRTNTPLQALTLMNNVTFVEAARFMAERMIRDGGSSVCEQIEFGFKLATGREPTEGEIALLQSANDEFHEQYSKDPKGATALLSTGAKPRDATLDETEHAAMTMTASLILNLDETITKE